MCGRYFSGELNGDYLCGHCVHLGAVPLRPLMNLDGLGAASLGSAVAVAAAEPRNAPRRLSAAHAALDQPPGEHRAKRQAA